MTINDITEQQWDSLRRNATYNKALDSHLEREADKASDRHVKERALDRQVAGTHYKKFKIQPAEFCYVNDIPYLEATAIKYLCRWKDKGGIQDLEKAKHFIDLLIEFQNANH